MFARGDFMLNRRNCIVLGLLGIWMTGCAGGGNNNQPPTVDRQMPAPKDPPMPPPARSERLDPALLASARAELRAALSSSDSFVRMHAIEAAANTLGTQEKQVYLDGLKDGQAEVRFASAMAIGQVQLADAKDALQQMVNDPNPQVGIAVRYALHRLGNKSYSKDLETTAKDPQVAIRAETARVLGLLGEPTATRVLLPMLQDKEDSVRLQAAESLWRLGDSKGKGLQALVTNTASAFPDNQMVALLALAAPGDRRVLGHLRAALTADYEEVCLVAARAMGMCGSDRGYAIAAQAVHSKDSRQRFLAAMALGAIGRSDAQGYLGELLKDRESADVRLAAAQGLLQLKSPPAASARGE
jgi:HEAT repeat protein